MMLAAALTAACVLALLGLLDAERRRDRRRRYLCKPLASAAFVAIPLASGVLAGDPPAVVPWLVAGLVLGAIGDVALMFPGRAAFVGGLVAFLCGHVAYVVGFHHVVPIDVWPRGAMIVAVIALAAIAGAVLRWLWPHLGALRLPVVAYVAVITVMELGAIALVATGGANRGSTMLLVGATLFFMSDLAVARERFVQDDVINKLLGLPAYYAAQLVIAWTTVVMTVV